MARARRLRVLSAALASVAYAYVYVSFSALLTMTSIRRRRDVHFGISDPRRTTIASGGGRNIPCLLIIMLMSDLKTRRRRRRRAVGAHTRSLTHALLTCITLATYYTRETCAATTRLWSESARATLSLLGNARCKRAAQWAELTFVSTSAPSALPTA